MHSHLDLYLPGASPLHRWEARCKWIGLLALIFAFALIQDLVFIPWVLLLALVVYGLSGLPLTMLWRRLRLPGVLLLCLIALMPVFVGQDVLLEFFGLPLYREGFQLQILTGAKFVSIFTLSVVLFATTPIWRSLKALRALGLPPLLLDMALLSYRYLFEISSDFESMRTAAGLRAYNALRLDSSNLRRLAALSGSLFLRSSARAERVYQAMRLRGYGSTTARTLAMNPARAGRSDRLGLAAALALALLMLLFTLWR